MIFNATINDIAEIMMGQSPKGEECNDKGLGLPLLNGPTEFTDQLQQVISRLTFERPVPENLQSEIYRLRQRMEQENARERDDRFNIKTGRGGMVDVEFITQYLQLLHGGEIKSLRIQNTVNLLECMAENHILYPTYPVVE